MFEDYMSLVKDKIYFVPKDRIIDVALKKGFIGNKKCTGTFAADQIIRNLNTDFSLELVILFKDIIGFTATELESYLNISRQERLKWAKEDLIKISGTYFTRAYGKRLECPIYDAVQVFGIQKKDIEVWRSAAKPLTDKQLRGLEKARTTAKLNRTCRMCGQIMEKKPVNGICLHCRDRITSMEKRRNWLENKDQYVILDTETTGLDSSDQIVEISIINLEGKVLLNSLVMPTVYISPGAYAIHGISMDYLKESNAPGWNQVYPEVKRILDGKTMLIYNAPFDALMIARTSSANGLDQFETRHECIMRNVMQYYSTDRYISLAEASEGQDQKHRSLDDCFLCLDIINNCAIEEKIDEIV